MGSRLSAPGLPDEQASAICELLVDMFRSREQARSRGASVGDDLPVCEQSYSVLRPPSDAAECACADLSSLVVERIYSSGSGPEGNDVVLQPPFKRSDCDVMFQLGPVGGLERVDGLSAQCEGTVEDTLQGQMAVDARGSAGACQETECFLPDSPGVGETSSPSQIPHSEGDRPSDQTANVPSSRPPSGLPEGVFVSQERTAQPGYVLLRHQRRPDCHHPGRLLFSASRAVRLLDAFGGEAADGRADRLGHAGPSVAVSFFDRHDIDLVACVECPAWPSEAFRARQRPSGHPSAVLVSRLSGTAALLVPVGFRGSAGEQHQWRLSFSRQEHAALRCLTAEQRACLTALKYCKALLGTSAAAVKSYYLKTALLWLAERHEPSRWTGGEAHRCLLAVLEFVETGVQDGRLSCYFWSDINVLASQSAAERRRLLRHAARMKRHLLAAATVLCISRQVQWQARGFVPADMVPCITRVSAADATSARHLRAKEYRPILKGNAISLKRLRKMVLREEIWPDESALQLPPVNMNNLLAGFLLVNFGPRGTTRSRGTPW